ncbi:MAG: UDP-N-acetylglucosamine 1-carboxyvinyltransferase [Oscillospiraceae bacterium]
MKRLIVDGGRSLQGQIRVQGAKNSALPLLAATILADSRTVLHNCPCLSDVSAALEILSYLGCKCERDGSTVTVDASSLKSFDVPDWLMHEMRSSIFFLGAIIGRIGKCRLCFPGGCEIGKRPIDLHINALKKMGVTINEDGGCIECVAEKGLCGADITLRFPSVGATENIILAAVTAKGTTVIRNAAREPEISDLADFLVKCGAKIKGAGESTVVIEGIEKLCGCEHTVIPDRIAAVTYLSCAAATRSEITLCGADSRHLQAVLPVFEQMGARILTFDDKIHINAKRGLCSPARIETAPYPGFPTDAQAILMAVAAGADGVCEFTENIFENRFRHVPELVKMGADIKTDGRKAVVTGVKSLHGARVTATDLRGGAALVTAGLFAEGETVIENIRHIDRGYECIEKSLGEIGARICRE